MFVHKRLNTYVHVCKCIWYVDLTILAWIPARPELASFNPFMTFPTPHYNDVIRGAIASQIASLTIVYSIVYSDADQRKHQSSAPPAFVRGIHRSPVNSPHKWPDTRKMFLFDDVIMIFRDWRTKSLAGILSDNVSLMSTSNQLNPSAISWQSDLMLPFVRNLLFGPTFFSILIWYFIRSHDFLDCVH